MATARLFVAVDLDQQLKLELVDCARVLREAFPDTKWVRPEAMHLTLDFLGDTPLEQLDDLSRAVAAVTDSTAPFAAEAKGVGVFPTPRRPAVVWAGIGTGSQALEQLAAQLRGGLAEAGFEIDPRPFSAHITLGRTRLASRSRLGLVEHALARWEGHAFGRIAVDRATAYASTLTPAGPVYEPLRVWSLGGPRP